LAPQTLEQWSSQDLVLTIVYSDIYLIRSKTAACRPRRSRGTTRR
jgi:hypothetical protein